MGSSTSKTATAAPLSTAAVRQQAPDYKTVKPYHAETLEGAIFVGHLVTDMDSIAGALGAADLYSGIPARASDVNSETKFCLERWGLSLDRLPPIEDMVVKHPELGICLVDHQQKTQMNPSIENNRVLGIIDHHALQEATVVTSKAVHVDIRPWGSMSTIIAHSYAMEGRTPPKPVAGMLLSAILSDTLNLKSPTTTDWDTQFVASLADVVELDSVDELAAAQFKAKSEELAQLSAIELVTIDQKKFEYKSADFKLGLSVIETTDDQVILDRTDELLLAMQQNKADKGYDALFLAVVNIVDLKSTLLLCSEYEEKLGAAAFPAEAGGVGAAEAVKGQCPLGGLVSRKLDFEPAIGSAIKGGFGKAQ